jgi:hypothetical protein
MNKLVGLIFLIAMAAVYANGWNKFGEQQQPVIPATQDAVTEKPKARDLLAHEPHPGDSPEIAGVRADYAARCTGAEPIGYTKQMCDELLYGIHKVDFARALMGLACTIGDAQSYACREELERREKAREK